MHDALIIRLELRAKVLKAEEKINFRFHQEKATSLFVILF